jgi:anti-sigma regulatory factor (Ser/Thr protein kinase)
VKAKISLYNRKLKVLAINITFENGRKKIVLPSQFTTSQDDGNTIEDVLNVMHSINVSVNKYGTPLHLDMTYVNDINASAALLFFAHVTSAQLVSRNSDFVKITLPVNIEIKNKIRMSGLWDAVKSGVSRKLDRNWETDNNFQSGYDPDKHLDLTLALLERRWGKIPNKLEIAINEAMLNITHHAYSSNPDNSIKRWWQYIFIRENILTFLIYDKGCGIPTSFKRMGKYNSLPDETIIEKAMTRYISSTGIQGRGNGSMNIKKPVAEVEKDKLVIFSEKGRYRYFKDGVFDKFRLPKELSGTLVAWQIGINND